MEDTVCNCSYCEQPITRDQLDGTTVNEYRKYKCGELQYIELFHAACEEQYLA